MRTPPPGVPVPLDTCTREDPLTRLVTVVVTLTDIPWLPPLELELLM